ncbi:unnamed protein product, partial [Amoebophrya sp. A120]|eukprot:GSA120T00012144001.1
MTRCCSKHARMRKRARPLPRRQECAALLLSWSPALALFDGTTIAAQWVPPHFGDLATLHVNAPDQAARVHLQKNEQSIVQAVQNHFGEDLGTRQEAGVDFSAAARRSSPTIILGDRSAAAITGYDNYGSSNPYFGRQSIAPGRVTTTSTHEDNLSSRQHGTELLQVSRSAALEQAVSGANSQMLSTGALALEGGGTVQQQSGQQEGSQELLEKTFGARRTNAAQQQLQPAAAAGAGTAAAGTAPAATAAAAPTGAAAAAANNPLIAPTNPTNPTKDMMVYYNRGMGWQCPSRETVTSAEECDVAATKLGLDRFVAEMASVDDPLGFPTGCLYDAGKRILLFNPGTDIGGTNGTAVVHNVQGVGSQTPAMQLSKQQTGGFTPALDLRFQTICKTLFPDNRLPNLKDDVVLNIDLSSKAHLICGDEVAIQKLRTLLVDEQGIPAQNLRVTCHKLANSGGEFKQTMQDLTLDVADQLGFVCSSAVRDDFKKAYATAIGVSPSQVQIAAVTTANGYVYDPVLDSCRREDQVTGPSGITPANAFGASLLQESVRSGRGNNNNFREGPRTSSTGVDSDSKLVSMEESGKKNRLMAQLQELLQGKGLMSGGTTSTKNGEKSTSLLEVERKQKENDQKQILVKEARVQGRGEAKISMKVTTGKDAEPHLSVEKFLQIVKPKDISLVHYSALGNDCGINGSCNTGQFCFQSADRSVRNCRMCEPFMPTGCGTGSSSVQHGFVVNAMSPWAENQCQKFCLSPEQSATMLTGATMGRPDYAGDNMIGGSLLPASAGAATASGNRPSMALLQTGFLASRTNVDENLDRRNAGLLCDETPCANGYFCGHQVDLQYPKCEKCGPLCSSFLGLLPRGYSSCEASCSGTGTSAMLKRNGKKNDDIIALPTTSFLQQGNRVESSRPARGTREGPPAAPASSSSSERSTFSKAIDAAPAFSSSSSRTTTRPLVLLQVGSRKERMLVGRKNKNTWFYNTNPKEVPPAIKADEVLLFSNADSAEGAGDPAHEDVVPEQESNFETSDENKAPIVPPVKDSAGGTTPTASEDQKDGDAADSTHDAREQKFNNIYENENWSSAGGGSGPGSTVNATAGLREQLHTIIKERNIDIMLDVPCGAMEWTSVFLREVWKYKKDFQYVGIDIADTPLDEAKARFSAAESGNNIQLMQADLSLRAPANAGLLEKIGAALATAEGRVKGKNALALTRDAVQHLSLKSACQLVENIRDATVTKSHKLDTWLIGHYPKGNNTEAAVDGGQILNNMLEWPYKMGEPELLLRERGIPVGEQTKWEAVYRPWEDWKAANFQACSTGISLQSFLQTFSRLAEGTTSRKTQEPPAPPVVLLQVQSRRKQKNIDADAEIMRRSKAAAEAENADEAGEAQVASQQELHGDINQRRSDPCREWDSSQKMDFETGSFSNAQKITGSAQLEAPACYPSAIQMMVREQLSQHFGLCPDQVRVDPEVSCAEQALESRGDAQPVTVGYTIFGADEKQLEHLRELKAGEIDISSTGSGIKALKFTQEVEVARMNPPARTNPVALKSSSKIEAALER